MNLLRQAVLLPLCAGLPALIAPAAQAGCGEYNGQIQICFEGKRPRTFSCSRSLVIASNTTALISSTRSLGASMTITCPPSRKLHTEAQ